MATTHAGNFAAQAMTVSRRIRRRRTTFPALSRPTTLQLFLPRSTPRTAISMAQLLLDRHQSTARCSVRGGPFIRGELTQAVGVSRGGRTTKIHCLADSRGRILAVALTPGNVADIKM